MFVIDCHWFFDWCSNDFHWVLIIWFTDLHWCSNDVHLYVIDFRSIFIKLSLMFHWVSLIFDRFLHWSPFKTILRPFWALMSSAWPKIVGRRPGLCWRRSWRITKAFTFPAGAANLAFVVVFFKVSTVFYWISLICHWFSTGFHWFAVVCFIEFHWFLIVCSVISTDVRTIFINTSWFVVDFRSMFMDLSLMFHWFSLIVLDFHVFLIVF